jgi:hypothetical protein
MNDVPTIGRCIGCDRPARLERGVCLACLTRRGRRWAEMSSRCRRDPEFALAVYSRIATDRGRALFLGAYGASLVRARSTTGRVAGKVSSPRGREPEEVILPPADDGEEPR